MPFPVVGIGASAGGLAALISLFEHLPDSLGSALVVVMHLSPTQPSDLCRILQSSTTLPVIGVEQAVFVAPNRVYVAPPGRTLKLMDGCFVPYPLIPTAGGPVAIDIFFRILAQTQREQAIAILLSGMGTDGATGLAYIKAQGGIAMAQLPSEALQGSMPQAAIDTGTVDFVLPVAEMPQKLLDLARSVRPIHFAAVPPELGAGATLPSAPGQTVDATRLQDVLAVLLAQTGHDFGHYKQGTLATSVERRMRTRRTPEVAGYCALLERDASEQRALLKGFFIGFTRFFRDRDFFAMLEQRVLPKVFGQAEPAMAVRAWIAACSTGEEAYSLAMLMADQASATPRPPAIRVLATDVYEPAIDASRAGRYPKSIETSIPPGRLDRYFVHDVQGYRVRKHLRDSVTFGVHDLLRDPPFSELDLVSCRNFLIYLNHEMQCPVLEMFHTALKPGGYLLLGDGESADELTDLYRLIDRNHRIYQAKRVERAPSRVRTLVGRSAPRRAATAGATSESAQRCVQSRSSNSGGRTVTENDMAMTPQASPTLQVQIDELVLKNEQQQSEIEELRTVNSELKARVEETGKANDDLNNLIVAVDLPTIFVDRQMRLQRYTPRTTALFNFIPVDVGRPLFDITHRLDYPQLREDVSAALATERLREREVRSRDGRTFLVRLVPYRTAYDRVDGVVLTFFDVSLQRDAEAEKTFLLQLSDVLGPITDPPAIQQAASRLLREHFGLDRVVFWEDAGDDTMAPSGASYAPERAQLGKVRLADFGAQIAAALKAGEVVIRDETADDQALAGTLGALFATEKPCRWIGVPRVVEGRLAGLLTAAYAEPHQWSPAQVALVREVAERTQTGLERGRTEEALRVSEARAQALLNARSDSR